MSLVKVPSTNVTIFQDFSKIFEFDSEKYSQNTERVPKCQFGIRKNFKCRHEKLQYYNRKFYDSFHDMHDESFSKL